MLISITITMHTQTFSVEGLTAISCQSNQSKWIGGTVQRWKTSSGELGGIYYGTNS